MNSKTQNEPTFAQVIGQAMTDWNNATKEQRQEALAYAAEQARRVERV